MKIILYNSSAENNRLDKSNYLNGLLTLEGTLRERCSILQPSILLNIIDYDAIVEQNNIDVQDSTPDDIVMSLINRIVGCNYVEIPDFKRYYFVQDVISEGKFLWRLVLTVDTLMSFSSDILSQEAMIARNENTYDDMVIDNAVNFEYDKEITYSDIVNLSAVETLSTTRSTNDNNCLIAFLTDDSTIHYSSSTPALDSLTSITSYTSAINMSTQYMVGNTGILFDMGRRVYKDNTLLTYIKSAMVYPFNISYNTDANVTTVKIGDTDYALTDTFKYPKYAPERILIAHFKMSDASSFLDYSPYTVYEIYIPYYGFVSLSGEAILGKTLKIFYLVNYEDGTANAYIYNITDDKIIFSAQCVVGVKVSLSSTNAREIADQKTALALNTGINLIGSALTIVAGGITENPIAVAGGIMKGASTIGNAVTTYNQLYDLGSVGISSGTDGLSNIQKVFLKKTKVKPKNYNADFAALYGKPLNSYRTLSSLSGFTQVSEIHLEGFDNATASEINQIESLLKSGIII